MKIWRKFLWIIVGVFIVGLLAISCYGIGEDLMGWLPLWLIKYLLGVVAFAIIMVMAGVFALGIRKIKELR